MMSYAIQGGVIPAMVPSRAPMPADTCFAALPSNLSALQATLSFATGRRPFVVVYGASGWGKSHLLRNAVQLARSTGKSVAHMSAETWLSSNTQAPTQPEMLVLDDLHTLVQKPKRRLLLHRELERRVRAGKPTLCAVGSTDASLRGLLPFPRTWLKAQVTAPCDDDRAAIVMEMCFAAGMEVSVECARMIAKLVRGDGHSLFGALSRTKIDCPGGKLDLLHPIRLAGILYPYTLDTIDLRDVVMKAVVQSSNGCCDDAKWAAISVFILERVAGLPEDVIASYFGMTPGEVYRLRKELQNRLDTQEPALHKYLEKALMTASLCFREN